MYEELFGKFWSEYGSYLPKLICPLWTWEDGSNIYIGRKGVVFVDGSRYPKNDSIWANPFKISDKHDRDSVIEMYRKYIKKKIRTGEISKEEIEKLRGKNLGCWCKNPGGKDIKCHGDVLVDILNSDG